MDELVIGEKKYISSKQAAKATGYAKDYVGQLCREGRVPARLVGRSWYVLESAIRDHRFADQKGTTGEKKGGEADKPMAASLSSWESPRYEASDTEVLPSVNRLRDTEEEEEKESEVAQRLQESWKAWFDRFDDAAAISANAPESLEEETSAVVEADIAVDIPIRAIHHQHYQPLPVSEEPVFTQKEELDEVEEPREEEEEPERGVRGKKIAFRTVQIAGVLFALCLSTAAVFGSGYLDKYIVSVSQARIIAGIGLYNK